MTKENLYAPDSAADFVTCFISIGSNLENPGAHNRAALQALAELERSSFEQASSFYQSDPVGPQDQPQFINSVACVSTALEPHALLDALQQIENKQGRVRDRRWGPRTLDLDILLYGDQIIQTERLTVPHAQMTRRAFVLLPLHEIAPDIVIPGSGGISTWLASVRDQGIKRLQGESGN